MFVRMSCVCVCYSAPGLPSVMHCVIFIILAADSRELDFIRPPTLTHKYIVADTHGHARACAHTHLHKFSHGKHIHSLTHSYTHSALLLILPFTHMGAHTHSELILSA